MRRRIIVLGPLCALMVLTSALRWVGHAPDAPAGRRGFRELHRADVADGH